MSDKLTLKEMEQIAKECGYTATEIFRQGMNCLQSSREALEADRKNPIKYQFDRIIRNMDDTQIAKNILREWWGIDFIAVDDVAGTKSIMLSCGIDEVTAALEQPVTTLKDGNRERSCFYQWVKIMQLPESYNNYARAFETRGHTSTTYEKAYGPKPLTKGEMMKKYNIGAIMTMGEADEPADEQFENDCKAVAKVFAEHFKK